MEDLNQYLFIFYRTKFEVKEKLLVLLRSHLFNIVILLQKGFGEHCVLIIHYPSLLCKYLSSISM